MSAVDQCSRCDAVDECVAGNITTLEDVAGVIGCPTPSLHVHLVQHDRDDLLRRLTYGGKPILPPLPEPAVEHQAVEDPGTFEVEGADYAEPVSSDSEWPEQPVWHLAEPSVDQAVMTPVLQNLIDHHTSEDVRCAAESLLSALGEWEQDLEARTRLEQLVAQRDQLNAEIEALAARLGDVEPEPQPEQAPFSAVHAGATAAQVSAWCRENGVHCPATGRVSRAAVEAYREAHGVA